MLESEYDTSTRSTTRECNWRATEKSMIEGARKGARRWTRLQYIDEHASPPPTATVFSGNLFFRSRFRADSGTESLLRGEDCNGFLWTEVRRAIFSKLFG